MPHRLAERSKSNSRPPAIKISGDVDREGFLDAAGAAKFLDVSESTFYELVKMGIVVRYIIRTGNSRPLVRYSIRQLRGIFKRDRKYQVVKEPGLQTQVNQKSDNDQ